MKWTRTMHDVESQFTPSYINFHQYWWWLATVVFLLQHNLCCARQDTAENSYIGWCCHIEFIIKPFYELLTVFEWSHFTDTKRTDLLESISGKRHVARSRARHSCWEERESSETTSIRNVSRILCTFFFSHRGLKYMQNVAGLVVLAVNYRTIRRPLEKNCTMIDVGQAHVSA